MRHCDKTEIFAFEVERIRQKSDDCPSSSWRRPESVFRMQNATTFSKQPPLRELINIPKAGPMCRGRKCQLPAEEQ